MSGVEVLSAQKRGVAGKGGARALRREGLVPCIIYGDKKEPIMVAVSQKELTAHCLMPGFYSRVFDVGIEGSPAMTVLPKAAQFHPVSGDLLHADFLRVNENAELRLHVPVEFLNSEKSPALKLGGVLNIVAHTVEVFCSPRHIPEKFEIDLEGAQMGQNFLASALNLPEGCRFAHTIHADSVIANIVQPQHGDVDGSTAEASSAADSAE